VRAVGEADPRRLTPAGRRDCRRAQRAPLAGGQRGEPGERGGALASPGPRLWEAQDGLAGVEGEPSCGVQQPVAQPLGFATRELAGQAERLGVGDVQLGGREGALLIDGGLELVVLDGEPPMRSTRQVGPVGWRGRTNSA
jgi:hypothetical protein